MRKIINIKLKPFFLFSLFSLLFSLLNCSFDYYEFEPTEEILPDLVMENVEYIRVKSAEPQARFQAERAERYEKQNLMSIENISFEQFGKTIEEVNTQGFAGNASIEIDSGNIVMKDGVRIEVESEDITIETEILEWIDESRLITTEDDNEVVIKMNNGTNFTGVGFSADARKRTWEFKGGVEGIYFFEEDEEDAVEEENAETEEDNQNE